MSKKTRQLESKVREQETKLREQERRIFKLEHPNSLSGGAINYSPKPTVESLERKYARLEQHVISLKREVRGVRGQPTIQEMSEDPDLGQDVPLPKIILRSN